MTTRTTLTRTTSGTVQTPDFHSAPSDSRGRKQVSGRAIQDNYQQRQPLAQQRQPSAWHTERTATRQRTSSDERIERIAENFMRRRYQGDFALVGRKKHH